MDFQEYPVYLRIRRYDLSDNPEIIKKSVNINPYIEYNNLKQKIQDICGVNVENKVIKIRNADEILVPLSFLTDTKGSYFFVDITNITYVDKNSANLLQDAYVDAVRQKVKTLESRIAQTELLLPQLEWRRQVYMDETVNGLTSKVAFLNRRFDVLLPKFQAKIPETMA